VEEPTCQSSTDELVEDLARPEAFTTLTDSLAGGATYYYVMTAIDANLVESVASQEVAAIVPEP